MSVTSSFEARQAQRVENFLQLVNWVGHRLGSDGPPLVDMPALRSLPTGTLGHAWVRHLDETGPEPFCEGSRRLQLHDGLHVPAPIRKEVRSGCCSQHLMNSTPSHRLWASAS